MLILDDNQEADGRSQIFPCTKWFNNGHYCLDEVVKTTVCGKEMPTDVHHLHMILVPSTTKQRPKELYQSHSNRVT